MYHIRTTNAHSSEKHAVTQLPWIVTKCENTIVDNIRLLIAVPFHLIFPRSFVHKHTSMSRPFSFRVCTERIARELLLHAVRENYSSGMHVTISSGCFGSVHVCVCV